VWILDAFHGEGRRLSSSGPSVEVVDDDPAMAPDPLAAELSRWAAELRAQDATRSRTRERWLRQQAEEGATWTGTLLDLAERRQAVVVHLRSGATLPGALVGVGEDVCLLAGPARRSPTTLVALVHVCAVRARAQAAGAASGDRNPTLRLTLAGALSTLAAEREVARIGLAGGGDVTGRILGAGADVLTLDPVSRPGDHRAGSDRVFVPIGAVETCVAIS
jgi:hypothetical protein